MKFVAPGILSGTVTAPSSKSIAQRGILAATLSGDITTLSNLTFCDDVRSALRVSAALGALVEQGASQVQITGHKIDHLPQVSCGESGLCLRLASALAALYSTEITLLAEGSLSNRPVDMVVDSLRNLSVTVDSQQGFPPLKIKGPMKAGEIAIDGKTTSQLLSGLLMALPLLERDSRISAPELASKPYAALTIEVLNSFGIEINADSALETFSIPGGQRYHGCALPVEGD